MAKYFLLFFLSGILMGKTYSQGCVAIRSTGGYLSTNHDDDSSKWQLNINNRYFKSYKHFIGTQEQKQRIENGTNVINHQLTTDFALIRR